MVRPRFLEYEQVEIKDVNLESLEDKLVVVTGNPKRDKQIFDSGRGLRYFTGALYSGKDVIKLEATVRPLNAGLFAFNFITSFEGVESSLSIGGRISKSKESPNEYVLVPHFLYGVTKEGKETIIPFSLMGPALVDIKKETK